MAIKSIAMNKNFSLFSDGERLELSLDEINVIYGSNGSGKTSLSKIFNILSDNIEVDKKKDMLGSLKTLTAKEDSMEIVCTLKDDTELNLQPQEYGLNICVFNSEYINSKILKVEFTDNSFEVKKDIETGSKISNPLEDDYNLKSRDFKKQEEVLKQYQENVLIPQEKFIIGEVNSFKSKVNSRKSIEDILSEVKELISRGILEKPINEENLLNKYNLYKNSDSEDKLPSFLEEEYVENLLKYKDKIIKLLEFDEDITKLEYAKNIVESSPEEKQKWIIQGINYISNEECPFCNRKNDEDTNNMIQAYKQYLESQYNEHKEKLLLLKEEIIKHCDIYKDFKELTLKAKHISTLIDDEIIFRKNIEIVKDKLGKIENEFLYAINFKLAEENICVNCTNDITFQTMECFDKIIQNIKKINHAILQTNNKIDLSDNKKKEVRDRYIDFYVIPYIANKYGHIYKKEEELKCKVNLAKKLMEEAKTLYLKDLEDKKPLIQKMNDIFKNLNLPKFKVDSNFHLLLSDVNINSKFRSYISDGEKTIIAFSLFIAELLLGYEKIDVIVIDDPISSLDYNHIYNITDMIKSLFKKYKTATQFVIMTHNNIFYNMLRYRRPYVYKKLFKTKEGTKISKDTDEKTVYMQKLLAIKQIEDSPEPITSVEKSFILNHCRYILENISNFFYPNCNDPLEQLKNELISEQKISKGKLNKLFFMIETGSHSLLDGSLDHDQVESDEDYKNACKTTIRIVQNKCGKQLMNL